MTNSSANKNGDVYKSADAILKSTETLPNLPSDAEAERLILLIEEAGEVIQAASKILRFGYDGYNQKTLEGNRYSLENELGDFVGVMNEMGKANDISLHSVNVHANRKWAKVLTYSRFQLK